MEVRRVKSRYLAPGLAALILLVAGCGNAATSHSIQPHPDRAIISGLSVQAAQRWLVGHTFGCEQITFGWVRPQQWECVSDGTPSGQPLETVHLVGDERGVYEIDSTLRAGSTATDAADTAASAFWMLMELPFGESGKPDYTSVKAAMEGGQETIVDGVALSYGRSGNTYTFSMTPQN